MSERVTLVKMEAEHLNHLMAQDSMASMRPFITPGHAEALSKGPNAFTVISASGRIAGCGGIAQYWAGRGEAWVIFDDTTPCRADFISIFRAIKSVLDHCPINRIEAAVRVGFTAGHRLVRALGFEIEAPVMEAYEPTGESCSLYARIK